MLSDDVDALRQHVLSERQLSADDRSLLLAVASGSDEVPYAIALVCTGAPCEHAR